MTPWPPAGGQRVGGLGIAGEGVSSADSEPQPVPAGAPAAPASGGAQRQAAEET